MNTLRNFNVLGTVAYVATAPYVFEQFSFSMAQMAAYNTSHMEKDNKVVYYDRKSMSWIPRGRNDIANTMRGDWVLMLDADLEFDPDILERMVYVMEKYKAPIVTGVYVYKSQPHYPVLYSYNAKREVYEVIAKWEGNPEIFKVDASGSGCLLIHKDVFTQIWLKLHEDPFDPLRKLGEDFSFYDRVRRLGIGVYCAPQVQVRHLGVTPHAYDPSLFNEKFLEMNKSK